MVFVKIPENPYFKRRKIKENLKNPKGKWRPTNQQTNKIRDFSIGRYRYIIDNKVYISDVLCWSLLV